METKWRQGGDEEDTEEDVLYVDNFFYFFLSVNISKLHGSMIIIFGYKLG